MSLFFIVETDIYYRLYDTIGIVDNIMVSISILGFLLGGYNLWNSLKVKSFATVIILNVLTELSYKMIMVNYYQIYSILICVFILTITMRKFSEAGN